VGSIKSFHIRDTILTRLISNRRGLVGIGDVCIRGSYGNGSFVDEVGVGNCGADEEREKLSKILTHVSVI
jgi:hypothetical protein